MRKNLVMTTVIAVATATALFSGCTKDASRKATHGTTITQDDAATTEAKKAAMVAQFSNQPDTSSSKATVPVTLQETTSGFPADTEAYQQYLSRTNDPDPTNIQYNMDFERFLRDHGAVEIAYNGFGGDFVVFVSYKNGIIVKFEFNERIPQTMHQAWNGGLIFANSTGPFSLLGDGYDASDWSKKIYMDGLPYDEMDYNDFFQISPDDAFYATWEPGSGTPTGMDRPPLSLERRFYENYMKYIEPYTTLDNYSMQVDPLP